MNNIESIIQKFLKYLTGRELDELSALFSEDIDWYIPGDETTAPWLGKRNSRQEIVDFYKLLWKNTEAVSAEVSNIYIDDTSAIIAGEFSTRMLQTGKVVDSLFFIHLTVENDLIVKYRLLEDSYAVSKALS